MTPTVVTITGEVDLATAEQVYDALSVLTGDVVVDGSAIQFIDSTGFGAFERAYEDAMRRGSSFQVVGLDCSAKRVAMILGLPYVIARSSLVGSTEPLEQRPTLRMPAPPGETPGPLPAPPGVSPA